MGNSEDKKSSEKVLSSPVVDQGNVHVYPDWAAMQAYYSPRFVVPQFFGANVPSAHTPHPCLWGPPQHMMPPYGPPYSAIYTHGGVYANPGVPPAPIVNTETPSKSSGNTDQSLMKKRNPSKSSGNTDQSLMKKRKGFNGLAMSTANSNANNSSGGANHTDSQSTETDNSSDASHSKTDNSSDASHSNTDKSSDLNPPKRHHRQETPTIDGDGDEDENPSGVLVKVIAPQPCSAIPNEAWLQNEREVKRQMRKQSNRESARRSRLRKQTELEELARKVEALTAENASLRSEMNRLTEISEKLMLENASLSSSTDVTEDGISNKTVVDNLIIEKSDTKTRHLLDATAVADE